MGDIDIDQVDLTTLLGTLRFYSRFRGEIPPSICAKAADRIEELEEARALGYATRLLEGFVAEHFPPNPDWRPLPELIGVLTQIDNAIVVARTYKARIAELEAALRPFADFADHRNAIPSDVVLTAGSALAKKQITMADCYAARAAFLGET